VGAHTKFFYVGGGGEGGKLTLRLHTIVFDFKNNVVFYNSNMMLFATAFIYTQI
jgi:hypothetical protein